MKLHYTPGSPFARIIRVLLSELDLECQEAPVAGFPPSAGHFAINPLGQMPALETPEGIRYPTRIIIEYLLALPRDGNTCLRLGSASFVIVLPDMPALMARATANKIAEAVRHLSMPHKASHAGIVTLSMGLAVTNPRRGYDRKFFEAGAEALKKAQRRGMGRIEGVDLRPAQERKRRAA